MSALLPSAPDLTEAELAQLEQLLGRVDLPRELAAQAERLGAALVELRRRRAAALALGQDLGQLIGDPAALERALGSAKEQMVRAAREAQSRSPGFRRR